MVGHTRIADRAEEDGVRLAQPLDPVRGHHRAVLGVPGALYGDEVTATVPAGSARYRLTASVRRTVPYSLLSTKVDVAWSFTSKRTTGVRPLPLQVVRYAPQGLDDLNRARPHSSTGVPLWVERTTGATASAERHSGCRPPSTTTRPGGTSPCGAPAPAGPSRGRRPGRRRGSDPAPATVRTSSQPRRWPFADVGTGGQALVGEVPAECAAMIDLPLVGNRCPSEEDRHRR
jgi:hypothetical protein